MWSKITYYIIYCWLFLHALLPLKVLYVLSDFLYLLVYHVIKYRRKVVRNNLKNSFPQKSQEEILKIEKEFKVKSPSVAKGIVQDMLMVYNTLSVKKTVEHGKIIVRAILVGPYAL